MRRFYSLGLFLIFIFSCSVDSEGPVRAFDKPEEIIGSWYFYEFTFSTGGSQISRNRIENDQVTLTFLSDGILNSSGYFNCDEANYSIEGNKLTVELACGEEVAIREFLLSWEGENLVLIGITSPVCIEGCSHIFKKV